MSSKKFREAMRQVSCVAEEMTRKTITGEPEDRETVDGWALRLCVIISEALTEPVLNCEVGTMAEQSKRHEEYCKSHTTNGRCGKCPLWQMRLLGINCAIAWANMPYEEGATHEQ